MPQAETSIRALKTRAKPLEWRMRKGFPSPSLLLGHCFWRMALEAEFPHIGWHGAEIVTWQLSGVVVAGSTRRA